MPPRRARSGSNASGHPTPGQRHQRPNKVEVPPHGAPLEHSALDSPAVPMALDVRYIQNMKVLKRQDPSVISILDQFPHVCVYRHDEVEDCWVKAGYEGTMFVCERDSYPPYGLLVLNRAGPFNYVVHLYPEDDIGHDEAFTIIRSWPDFTAKRLAPLQSHPDAGNKFSSIYTLLVPMSTIPPPEKGVSRSVSFWWHVEGQPEDRMTSVVHRVYGYLRQGLPYPEEFKNGNGVALVKPVPAVAEKKQEVGETATASEIDKLFARFTPAPSAPETEASTPTGAATPGGPTVDSLFAGLTNGHSTASHTPSSSSLGSTVVPERGLSLLESIFASATPAATNGFGHPAILSPAPSSSAIPAVLAEEPLNPLGNLLRGLTRGAASESRSSSAAQSSASGPSTNSSYRSRRYEGDVEDSSDAGFSESGGLSESSTVLDEAEGVAASANGDITPRPLLRNELAGPPAPRNPRRAPSIRPSPSISSVTSAATATGRPQASTKPVVPATRPPVPFEAQSELWPYPRAPLDDRNLEDDIVELDFADTSALSDVDAFRRASQSTKHKEAPDAAVLENGDSKTARKKKGKKERAVDKARAMDDGSDAPNQAGPSFVPAAAPVKPYMPIHPKAQIQVARGNVLDQGALRASIAATIEGRSPPLARNDFIREFWILVQNDKVFVDTLYQDYLARSQ